jgi:hypothetical protein
MGEPGELNVLVRSTLKLQREVRKKLRKRE